MKIAFAHIEKVVDFDTKEEALAYINKNSNRGWFFITQENGDVIYSSGNNNYSLVVRQPYKNYKAGW